MSKSYKPTNHERYLHFNMRMMDRYGMSVDHHEYEDLQYLFDCGYYDHIKKCRGGTHSHYIKMEFRQTTIYMIAKNEILMTAVTKNQVDEDSSKKYKDMVKESNRIKNNRVKEDMKSKGNRKRSSIKRSLKP